MWRLFYKVVPTDDKVKSMGIPIVSRCVCCRAHCEETSVHLFFQSDWAVKVWTWLSRVFGKERPYGLASLEQRWLTCPGKLFFVECIRVTMVCCMLWELWKGRNFLIHEGQPYNWFRKGLAWTTSLSTMISRSYVPSLCSERLLDWLGINARSPNLSSGRSNPSGGVLLVSVQRGPRTVLAEELIHGLLFVSQIAMSKNFRVAEFQSSHPSMFPGDSLEVPIPWACKYKDGAPPHFQHPDFPQGSQPDHHVADQGVLAGSKGGSSFYPPASSWEQGKQARIHLIRGLRLTRLGSGLLGLLTWEN
ncbi:hypothetical protein QQ045_016968 [Rhodiola kirilowii]